MALKNKNILLNIFLFILLVNNVESKIILPELMTKQSVSNIRFLSSDGRFTYYQKRSGSLLYSTNYKVQEILKSEIGTEYSLIASPSRKKIVILQRPNFHSFYSIRAKSNMYLMNYGENIAKKIGSGNNPQLHLEDNWLSYFDHYSKTILFENTVNSVLKFSIKLNNRINPYFLPQVIMADDDTIFYTDLSENGEVGLLQFKRSTNKSEIIFKAKSSTIRAEICLHQKALVLGLFGIHHSSNGSSLNMWNLPSSDFSKKEIIYTSELNDIGHMICNLDNTIVFVKNFGNPQLPTQDVASIEVTTKKISQLTEMKTISTLLNMDGILLTQDKGKYYIVKGDVDFKNMDILKPKVDSSIKPETKATNENKEEDDE